MRRLKLIERAWQAIAPLADGHQSRARDNCLFINAVLYRVRTGVAWCDLPEHFGPWNMMARRFRRWALASHQERIFQAVQEPDYEQVLVNSTTVEAPEAATGPKKALLQRKPSDVAEVVLAANSTPQQTPLVTRYAQP